MKQRLQLTRFFSDACCMMTAGIMRCGERPDPARHQGVGPGHCGHRGHQRREGQQPGRSQVRMPLYLLQSFFSDESKSKLYPE